MRLTRRHRLALLLNTAAQWHSDRRGGINLLSLSSTRKVHNGGHRARLLEEIRGDITYCLGRSDVTDAMKDIRQLAALGAKVASVEIGVEWLSDKDNLKFNEELFQAGML